VRAPIESSPAARPSSAATCSIAIPPRSADIVNQILDDFRSGRQNVAEFWINFHGKFVHIRYFAVRSKDGAYLGTLELTQDLAPLRQLAGERRLLSYEAAG